MAKTATKKPRSLYSVHPGVFMVQKWIQELPEKTGRSLEQWVELVKKSGPATFKERCDWLKSEHGMGTNAAWWIAERADEERSGVSEDTPEDYLRAAEKYVEDMFSGGKAGLRPIYDALLKLCLSIGNDVKACPCQTIVPLYRNHVFAQIKPATRTRIDMGFALKNQKAKGRLIDTGGFAKKDRITHRIPITNLQEIDDEVEIWLKTAYQMDVKP